MWKHTVRFLRIFRWGIIVYTFLFPVITYPYTILSTFEYISYLKKMLQLHFLYGCIIVSTILILYVCAHIFFFSFKYLVKNMELIEYACGIQSYTNTIRNCIYLIYVQFFTDIGMDEISTQECSLYMSQFSMFFVCPSFFSVILSFFQTNIVSRICVYIYLVCVWCGFVVLFGEMILMTEQ
jgi:hypothetical protein